MKTRNIKSFALMALIILCTVMFSGCYLLAGILYDKINDPSKEFKLVGEPTITCTYNEEYKVYDVVVDGVAANSGDDSWCWVSVTLVLYDADHNVVGSAMANVEIVQPQSNWRFHATGEASYEVASVELHEFTGERYY